MTRRRDTLRGLLPRDLTLALTGPDATRAADSAAARKIGVRENPDNLADNLRVRWRGPVALVIVTAIILACVYLGKGQVTRTAHQPYLDAGDLLIVPLVSFVAIVMIAVTVGWAFDATEGALSEYRDSRLSTVHPYARGDVIAVPVPGGMQVVVQLLIPYPILGCHRFDFRRTVVETTHWSVMSLNAADAHAEHRRREITQLTHDAKSAWQHAMAAEAKPEPPPVAIHAADRINRQRFVAPS